MSHYLNLILIGTNCHWPEDEFLLFPNVKMLIVLSLKRHNIRLNPNFNQWDLKYDRGGFYACTLNQMENSFVSKQQNIFYISLNDLDVY